ncbi:MAG: RNA polymerase sigma factor [Saprospiraceae bacterium]
MCNKKVNDLSHHKVDKNAEEYEKDKLLVAKVLQGDQAAFAAIIKNSERMTAHVICRMIKSIEDQKDIAQEVYIKAFRNLSGFKFQSKLSTWLCQIAYNSCINHLGKKKFTSLDELIPSGHEVHFDDEVNSSANNTLIPFNLPVYPDNLGEILAKEIQKLPSLYQTLIGLYHQEELSYSEIREITQLPEGTVKNYLYRARKTLKENILLQYKREDL